jgi:hypothetical protein
METAKRRVFTGICPAGVTYRHPVPTYSKSAGTWYLAGSIPVPGTNPNPFTLG